MIHLACITDIITLIGYDGYLCDYMIDHIGSWVVAILDQVKAE